MTAQVTRLPGAGDHGPRHLTQAEALRRVVDSYYAVPAAERHIHTEDVEWLADTGCEWLEIESRTGFCRNSIETHLHREGRQDVLSKIRRNSVRGLW